MLFLVVIFLTFLIIVFTRLGFPYTGNPESPAPQRFWIFVICFTQSKNVFLFYCYFQHTSRTFHNESGQVYKTDSGYFLNNMDRNSPNSVKKYVPELENAQSLASDCDTALFCGLPLGSSRAIKIM